MKLTLDELVELEKRCSLKGKKRFAASSNPDDIDHCRNLMVRALNEQCPKDKSWRDKYKEAGFDSALISSVSLHALIEAGEFVVFLESEDEQGKYISAAMFFSAPDLDLIEFEFLH